MLIYFKRHEFSRTKVWEYMKSDTKRLILDCSDFDCPMVLAQLKEALERVEPGRTVEVITDSEPRFQMILKLWAKETNDCYYDFFEKDKRIHHFIKKASPDIRSHHEQHPHVITNTQLKQLLSGGEKIHLLDVREDIEFMIGHVPEAVNVPLSDFTARISAFPREETYYLICRTGNRSDFACKYMKMLGYGNVYNVLPGMYQWDGDVI